METLFCDKIPRSSETVIGISEEFFPPVFREEKWKMEAASQTKWRASITLHDVTPQEDTNIALTTTSKLCCVHPVPPGRWQDNRLLSHML
jgi:hypothetical protein